MADSVSTDNQTGQVVIRKDGNGTSAYASVRDSGDYVAHFVGTWDGATATVLTKPVGGSTGVELVDLTATANKGDDQITLKAGQEIALKLAGGSGSEDVTLTMDR